MEKLFFSLQNIMSNNTITILIPHLHLLLLMFFFAWINSQSEIYFRYENRHILLAKFYDVFCMNKFRSLEF